VDFGYEKYMRRAYTSGCLPSHRKPLKALLGESGGLSF
jgi:hypothetical protein